MTLYCVSCTEYTCLFVNGQCYAVLFISYSKCIFWHSNNYQQQACTQYNDTTACVNWTTDYSNMFGLILKMQNVLEKGEITSIVLSSIHKHYVISVEHLQ